MGQLTVLSTIFNLQTNSLDGAVPTQLGHMTGLTYYLGLSNNKLTKAVPTQLGRMTGLASALLLSRRSDQKVIESLCCGNSLVVLSIKFLIFRPV